VGPGAFSVKGASIFRGNGTEKLLSCGMEISRQYTLELLVALLAVPLLLGTALAVGRWLVKRADVPLGVRFKIAASALCAYLPLSAYQWIVTMQFATLSKGPTDVLVDGAAAPAKPFLFPEELLQALLALSIFFGALVAVKLVRRYFWDGWFERTQDAEAPKFVSDIGSACILGVALVIIATGVYHKDLSGLRLGSTVSVAVLGFASQDLLGNLLSGIALQIGSPFRKGDWLQIDGKRLQVREVNWRSTRMRSPDNVLVDVPNKTIASGTIVNLSAPTSERASSVIVGFEYSADPEAVKTCLIQAARSARAVMLEPAPRAVLKEFGDSSIRYELSFWVEREEYLFEAADAVRTAIWQEAQRRSLTLPCVASTATSTQGNKPTLGTA
jgi:small-conductance mechanosensitive channel